MSSRAVFALATVGALSLTSCGDAVTSGVPTTIRLGSTVVELPSIGAWHALTADVLDQDGAAMNDVAPSFSSADPSVATVSGEGIVTAVGNGSTTVTASFAGLTGSAEVVVDQVVTALSATVDTIAFMDPGDSSTVSVAAVDGLGADASGSVLWTSRAPSIASVDAMGTVRAVATGSAFVVAEADGVADSVFVRVAPELTVAHVGATTVEASVDEAVTLAARVEDLTGAPWSGGHVSWSVGAGSGSIVSAQEVESDITGHVGAVWRLGTTAATQRAFAQISSRGAVTVIEFLADAEPGTPVSASLVADSVLLSAVGETAFLGPTYLDAWGNVATGGAASFASADAAIVSVSPDGLLSGTGYGQTMVSVDMPGGGDSILVTVVPRGAITVTFDDGWRTVYDNAWPVFQDFDFPANVGVYTEATTFPAYMTEQHLDELHAAGWSMVSHTVTHSSLPTLSAAELDFELRASQAWLEDRGYRGTNVLIAPYHQFEDREKSAAAGYYEAARGAGAHDVTPDSLVAWRPDSPFELTGFDADLLPYTTVEGRDRLRALLQRTADEGLFLDVIFHQIPAGNVAAFRATLEVIDEFRERVLPYHELFPIFARSVR